MLFDLDNFSLTFHFLADFVGVCAVAQIANEVTRWGMRKACQPALRKGPPPKSIRNRRS